MKTPRRLGRIRTLPPPAQGQFGPAHEVVEVIRPGEWSESDPFILLMDDRIHGVAQAGPHPHAGFETVSFLVEGGMPSEHAGSPRLSEGDVEWTTTGSGIVHGPDAPSDGSFRLLQLWVTLPKAERWTEPDHQFIRKSAAQVRTEPGAMLRLYSGSTGSLVSPTRNRVPMILVEVTLEPGAAVTQEVPSTHNGFLYVLEGEARIGDDEQRLIPGQVGWLNRVEGEGGTELRIANATTAPMRLLLYTGERQNTPLAWYGPFIGDTREDIARSFERYQSGQFRRV